MPLCRTSKSIMKVSSSITPKIIRKSKLSKGFLTISGGIGKRPSKHFLKAW